MKSKLQRPRHYGTFGYGDRAQFYVEFAFEPQPDSESDSIEDELSWGAFQIWVKNRNLCRHYVGTEQIESVKWHLLPLIEWLAVNWDFLFHEQRPPVRYAAESAWASLAETNSAEALDIADTWDFASARENAEWAQRHCLTSCREGGLFPEIVFRRLWGDVEISWGQAMPPGAPSGFRFAAESGFERLEPRVVTDPLFEVIESAVKALHSEYPNSKRFKKLATQIEALSEPHRQLRRVSILAGLGEDLRRWNSHWSKLYEKLMAEFATAQSTIQRLFGAPSGPGLVITGSCQGALMFGAVAPTLRPADVFRLAAQLVAHSTSHDSEDKLAAYAEHRSPGSSPWREGYRLARGWAETSQLGNYAGVDFVDIEAHLQTWNVIVNEVALSDEQIGGVAIACENRAPMILLNTNNLRNQFPSGRRFSLAHEFCHLLYDRFAGLELALISGPWAPPEIEGRANAFAAMLLMPDNLVEKAFAAEDCEPTRPEFNAILRIAKRLHASPDALVHHLANRGRISSGRCDLLLQQLIYREN